MKRRANPTLIGLFILGAIALIIIGIGALAPTLWWGDRATFVSVFDESVHGLEVGAQIKFQGVPVGHVREINARIDVEDMTLDVPVRYDIDLQRLRAHAGDFVDLDDAQVLEDHIEAGLRAQLQLESFVTGLLFVNLAYFDEPPTGTADQLTIHPEIPTIPSPLAVLETQATDLMASAHSVLNETSRMLDEFEADEISTALIRSAEAVERLADAPEIREALRELPEATEQLKRTLAEVETLAARAGSAVDPFQAQVEETSEEAILTLQAMREAMEATRGALEADSGLGYQIDEALESLTRAAEALRQLALSLERDPSMLLRGRSPEE